jgi:hypothetical protein
MLYSPTTGQQAIRELIGAAPSSLDKFGLDLFGA